MGNSISLSLTDEPLEFIDRNWGDGTLFATPSESLRDLLREKKGRMEAAEMRDAILEGYRESEPTLLEETHLVHKIFLAKIRNRPGWLMMKERGCGFKTCQLGLYSGRKMANADYGAPKNNL